MRIDADTTGEGGLHSRYEAFSVTSFDDTQEHTCDCTRAPSGYPVVLLSDWLETHRKLQGSLLLAYTISLVT
jgi:hypothetical protein